MSLAPGVRLGAYEIVALIGAGGMGEVYRARDSRLKRDVAIKILPDAFANDPERLARFQREAELLATLNHPNIGAVYGLEQADSANAIVLELVEGDTLAELVKRGPVKVQEAIRIALQIAEALEDAHERGVIHRDLKPANIKITRDGKVKVLDFGLAKLAEPSGVAQQALLSHSPTLSALATNAGVILGTAAYMSPEQAKGLTADQRSDIFSFGCVVYEMIAGRSPFHADTAAEIFASVIVREADLNILPASLDPRLRSLIRRCLEKTPKKRWQAIGDVRAEMETIATSAPVPVAASGRIRFGGPLAVVAAGIIGALLATTINWMAAPTVPPPIVTRFSVPLPETRVGPSGGSRVLAISPDGTQLLFVDSRQLHLRSMGDTRSRLVSGTDPVSSISSPVFSPDGQSIAFGSMADRRLKKIAAAGGVPVTLAPIGDPFGITWSEHGILVGQGPSGIIRVPQNGGTPEQLVKVGAGEQAHGPQMLPDGETVLFTIATGGDATRWDNAAIVVQSIKSGARQELISGGTDARYLDTGHIIYVSRGVLFGVAFDVKTLSIQGGAVPLVEGVAAVIPTSTGSAQFSVSKTGSLIYIGGPTSTSLAQRLLALMDRSGNTELLKAPAAAYQWPRFSPNGRQIVVMIEGATDSNIWIVDASGALSPRRMTFGGHNRFPIWSPDGQRVAYQSNREGDLGIFWQRADGTGPAERMTKPDAGDEHRPDHFSPDGRTMAFTVVKGTAARILLLNLTNKKTSVFAEAPTRFISRANFSPDGKWIAYTSNEGSIRPEVFVQPYPPTGARYQVGTGTSSRGVTWWSHDGKELFFNDGPAQWFVVAVSTQPSFTFGPAREIPRAGLLNPLGSTGPRSYDPTPDGKRMLIVTSADADAASTSPQINVVLNWFEELKQRIPVK